MDSAVKFALTTPSLGLSASILHCHAKNQLITQAGYKDH